MWEVAGRKVRVTRGAGDCYLDRMADIHRAGHRAPAQLDASISRTILDINALSNPDWNADRVKSELAGIAPTNCSMLQTASIIGFSFIYAQNSGQAVFKKYDPKAGTYGPYGAAYMALQDRLCSVLHALDELKKKLDIGQIFSEV